MAASTFRLWLLLIAATFGSACRSDLELPMVAPPKSGVGDMMTGCEELRLGDARFYGAVDPAVGEMTYNRFGVNLVRDPSGVGTPTFLKVGNQQIRLREVTPDTLLTAGFPERRLEYSPRRIFGVRLNEGSDAGVDLTYAAGNAEHLSARCYPGQQCNFWIGWEGHPMIALPVRESVLKRALPAAGTVRPCRSPF